MNEIVHNPAFIELERSLDADYDTPTSLCDSMQSLLSHDAARMVVGTQISDVSVHFSRVPLGDKEYIARIAQAVTKKDEEPSLPYVLFLPTEVLDRAVPYQRSLFFKSDAIGGPALITANELNPLVNDTAYLELVSTIVDDIEVQVAPLVSASIKTRRPLTQVIAAKLQDMKEYYGETKKDKYGSEIGKVRKAKAMGLVALMTLGYGHLAFTNADATIGPVPLPQPIELLADWSNEDEHDAQGFLAPTGAADVSVAQGPIRPPLIASYRTSGAPDAGTSSYSLGSSARNNDSESSRAGLYEIDFELPVRGYTGNTLTSTDTNVVYETEQVDNGCLPIQGDFTEGRTTVFTQTKGVEEKVVINVIDQSTAEICAVDDAEIDGSIFIYQK